ncbi:hypothetical protein ACFVJM_08505 [Streptomyces virginiae]|uniref:hypothetical protein n=1 Tax=Streptomyces virginiae TaxID=1961 RepID=UPI00363E2552
MLDAPEVDVTGLSRHTRLRVLHLGHRRRPAGPADRAEISRPAQLEERQRFPDAEVEPCTTVYEP